MENILDFDDFLVLNEANRTYPKDDFIKDVKKMGWDIVTNDHVIKFVKTIKQNDGKDLLLYVTGHKRHDGNQMYIDPKTIQHVVNNIKYEFYITKDKSVLERVPWDKWQLKMPNLNNPEEMNVVKWSNNRYNKVELIPLKNLIYNADDGVCLMKKREAGKVKYNTCLSETDRRPMCQTWFDDIWPGLNEGPDWENKKTLPTGYGFVSYIKGERERRKTGAMMKIYPILTDGNVDMSVELKEMNIVAQQGDELLD